MNWLFNPSGLTPHGFCLLWQPGLIWLHAGSDTVIAVAYCAIPLAMLRFARQRPDLSFLWLSYLFVAFILACGTTHMLDVVTLWRPIYGLAGLAKLATAVVSVSTAAVLWHLVPSLVALPSPAHLAAVNMQLAHTNAELNRAGEMLLSSRQALHETNTVLERRVLERTEDLQAALSERDRLLAALYAREGELRTALRDANRATRAKSRFLASMSHELRTPLNGILGYAQLLRLEGALTPVQSNRVDTMLDAGAHLLDLINRVLDLTAIESEKLTLLAEEIDPRGALLACLDVVRPAAAAKGLALKFIEAPDAPAVVTADPTRLKQIVLNLLGNAVKFTGTGAVDVILRGADGGATVRVEVVDTGRGIPGDQRDKLFQDFERFDEAAPSAVEGAGMGLALSARLATMMSGRLGHADNEGGGSVFWLELPVCRGTGKPRAAALREDGAEESRRLRVLVVDDVSLNREVAGGFLRVAGHHVACAESGAQAVAAVANDYFDVVLMDVRMPGMDGLEATRRIRNLPGARGKVPIIALTAQTLERRVEDCSKAGMGGHLAKPFTQDALAEVVQNAAR